MIIPVFIDYDITRLTTLLDIIYKTKALLAMPLSLLWLWFLGDNHGQHGYFFIYAI